MKKIVVIYESMLVQMRQSFVRPMFKFCLFFNPIISTILLYEMYINSGETNYFAYVVLGSGLMGLWGCICFSSAGDINRERHSGTLAIIYTAPVSFREIVVGKIMGNTILSIFSFVMSLLVAKILFHIEIDIKNPFYFLFSFVATIVVFVIIATIVAFLLMLSRKTELYMNCIEVPLIMLSGFVFPVDLLPKPLQLFSRLIPSTYAVELLRITACGIEDINNFWNKVVLLTGISLLYVLGARLLYRIIDKRVRIKGNLNVV
ncbi:MAG: ABC transporter permease [Pseudobutyrivibrio sp.]|uniref:ABC transporter permease n=1 Tax=Pseudobutyrivibrio sp. TaxID=2014367 RepID=UPI001B69A674|nr:ABC transporter permease [Pseudobutyrivibrio sp.]MBP3727373.1 ABC transporter permease [Pseudobutyrivibrio sp.]MBQ8490601.1 ABC transporter permease [Pseudobutyrivibrio sp.]